MAGAGRPSSRRRLRETRMEVAAHSTVRSGGRAGPSRHGGSARPRGTLGVLGGMGPAATAEFLRLLAVAAPATTDQDHPRIVMLSEPGVPDRTRALLTGSEEPFPALRAGLCDLVRWGADLLAIPCNTAHAFVDRFSDELPVPVLHIADATLRQAVRTAPAGCWLVATSGTVVAGLYQRRARRLSYRLLVPRDELGGQVQARIERTVALVKAGRTAEAAVLFGDVARTLWRHEPLPIVAACTDIPL